MSKPKVISLATNSWIIPPSIYVALSVCDVHEGQARELLSAEVVIVFLSVMSCLQI